MPNSDFKIIHFPLPTPFGGSISEKGPRQLHGDHDGMDLAVAVGQNVYAAHDGVVIKVGNNVPGYGNVVVIKKIITNDSGIQTPMLTLYAHLDSIDVVVGQTISESQALTGFTLGKSGNTGTSKGPHLHFEVMDGNFVLKNGKTILDQIEGSSGTNENGHMGIASSFTTTTPYLAAPRLNPRNYDPNHFFPRTIETGKEIRTLKVSDTRDNELVKTPDFSLKYPGGNVVGLKDVGGGFDSYFAHSRTSDPLPSFEQLEIERKKLKDESRRFAAQSAKDGLAEEELPQTKDTKQQESHPSNEGQLDKDQSDKGQFTLNHRAIDAQAVEYCGPYHALMYPSALPSIEQKKNTVVTVSDSDNDGKVYVNGYLITSLASGDYRNSAMPLRDSKMQNNSVLRFLTILICVLCFLVSSRTEAIESNAIKSESSSNKTQRTKHKYTEEQKQSIYRKIDEANKNPNYDLYKNLTQEEKLARLEMMKERYSMGWFEEMFPEIDDEDLIYCNALDSALNSPLCATEKLLPKISQKQVIGIMVNYDDYFDKKTKESGKRGNEVNAAEVLNRFISSIIIYGVGSYVDDVEKINGHYNRYSKIHLLGREINDMISGGIILKRFREYEAWEIEARIKRLQNFLNNPLSKTDSN